VALISKKSKTRPGVFDRLSLRFAESRLVDGFWVGVSNVSDQSAAVILERVEDALRMIRTHDPRRYQRVRRDLDRIWVRVQIAGNRGLYNSALRACELDLRYLIRSEVQPTDIASTIVHEATHARLYRLGYPESLRVRIEAACRRQEQAFSERLPPLQGERVRERLQRMDGVTAEFWSDATFRRDYEVGVRETLRYVGIPRWSLPLFYAVRNGVRRLRRLVRAIARFASGLTGA
jgi:hypothetical protein